MQLDYKMTRADFKAFYLHFMSSRKAKQRNQYYWNFYWLLALLALSDYLAFKHEEIFIAFVIIGFAVNNIARNWSFEKGWSKSAEYWATWWGEGPIQLTLDPAAITGTNAGVSVIVPWKVVTDYTQVGDNIFIHYLQNRGFTVALRDLTSTQRYDLIETLEQNKVPKRN